jgi:hypothetical protein
MDKELTVVLTRTYDLKPLAVVRNLPGGDAEMTPDQMRSLADALRIAAEECESRPMGKRTFMRVTKSYGLAEQVR